MNTIMIHHVGDGVNGSISIKQLDRIMYAYPDDQYTFDDGLACQVLAFQLLRKHGKKAIFFVNNENKMEQYRVIRERLGDQFYNHFWNNVANDPYFSIPNDFLAEYSFYTEEDRRYRYYRDYLAPERHDEIMNILLLQGDEPCFDVEKPLFIDPQMIVGEGHILGLHSSTHPRRMDALKPHEQFDEWVGNLAYIRKFQREVLYAAYPMGRYNEVTKEILSLLGIMDAFTSSELTKGYLESPRIDLSKFL